MIIAAEVKLTVTSVGQPASNGRVNVTGKLESGQFWSLWMPKNAPTVKTNDVLALVNVKGVVATLSIKSNNVKAFCVALLKAALEDTHNKLLSTPNTPGNPFSRLFWIQQTAYCEYVFINDSDTAIQMFEHSNGDVASDEQKAEMEALLAGLTGEKVEPVKDAAPPATTSVQKPRLGNKKQVATPAQG